MSFLFHLGGAGPSWLARPTSKYSVADTDLLILWKGTQCKSWDWLIFLLISSRISLRMHRSGDAQRWSWVQTRPPASLLAEDIHEIELICHQCNKTGTEPHMCGWLWHWSESASIPQFAKGCSALYRVAQPFALSHLPHPFLPLY